MLRSSTDSDQPTPTFDELGLSPVTLESLRHATYELPTPVQVGLIPRALEGSDVLGQARTGTGKTASFVIPILECLDEIGPGEDPMALVLVPTRELAVQVEGEVKKLSRGRRVSYAAVYGGSPIKRQIDKLKRGVDVVVGTPGRILDHLSRRTICFDDLQYVVLDEADRMLDIGFRPDIEKILRRCPKDRQTLLLSATLPPVILRLAQRYMRDPVKLDFSAKDLSVETIEQFYFTVEPMRKFELLQRLLQREKPAQAIVFCRTKRGTEKVHQKLHKKFSGVACMHGDMQQRQRNSVMERFRAGKVSCLVATDVVGRGIDVTGISHIINYDIPQFSDDYVHRVGRTGRMGREGVAYTFVTPDEGGELTKIEMRIDRLLKPAEMEGFETVRESVPAVDEPDTPPPPKPLYNRSGRPIKKYRRAL